MPQPQNHRLYLVTNGDDFAYWNYRAGVWDIRNKFQPDCLLEESEAQSVQRQFNNNKYEDDSDWQIKSVWLEFETDEQATDTHQ